MVSSVGRPETAERQVTPGRCDGSFFRLGWENAVLLVGVLLATAISFAHRYTINPDALSYLEVGEAWWRGDFANAINGYWNPIYPILIAGLAKLAPNRMTELFGPHFLNVLIFVGAAFAFRGFLNAVEEKLELKKKGPARFYFRLGSYAVFGWATFCLIEIGEMLPDLLLSVVVLLAGRSLLQLDQRGTRAALMFGLTLGLAYLIKPVMFPLGIVFLAGALGLRPDRSRFISVGTAAAVFLTVSGLYWIPLSIQKQHFTFSESGRLAYAWEVNGFTPYFHWQGEVPESGTPKHPTRQILSFPPAFEFDRNRPGTYPLWYDASYWNEGMRTRFNLSEQVKRTGQVGLFYLKLAFMRPVPAIFLLSLIAGGTWIGWGRLGRSVEPFFPLILFAVATSALYALVFALPRYFASVATFLGVSAFAGYLGMNRILTKLEKNWFHAFAVVAALSVLWSAGFSTAYGLFGHKSTTYRVHARVVAELQALGVKPGDKMAIIGRGCDPYFARLMGSQVVAEAPIFEYRPPWHASEENLNKIVGAMTSSSTAVAIVSQVVATDGHDPAWKKVENTPFWVRKIERPMPLQGAGGLVGENLAHSELANSASTR